MNKYTYLLFLFVLALCSCSEKKTVVNSKTFIFEKNKCIPFAQSNIFRNKKIITLETNNEILIPGYPSLLMDDDFFIYSKNYGGAILRFDSNGHYLNKIGNEGTGPEEYTSLSDISLNTTQKDIEILAYNGIYKYSYDGLFLQKKVCDYPATAFLCSNNGDYWLYIGNNTDFSTHKLIQTDNELRSTNKYLESQSNMLPVVENNFGKGKDFTTFHESFNNQLYIIKNDSVIPSYLIQFPNLEIPTSAFSMDPMELLPFLKQNNWAMVQCYLENKKYIYLLIKENNPIENKNIFYHWIIDKDNNSYSIINQNHVTPDSYLLSPQLLTSKNELIYIGYPIENENELANTETNPSIFIIDLSTK